MKKHIVFLFIIILSLGTWDVKAQQTLAVMNENIYSTNYNPGKPSLYKWHASIPGISNFNIAFSENLLTYKKLVTSTDTSKIINPRGLLKGLKRPSRFIFDLNEEILGFGLRTEEVSYFSFSTRLRSETYVFLPNEWFSMMIEGNAEYIGENVESRPGIFHSTYLEFGISYQYTIQNKYTVGIRPKLLFGITNIHTTQSSINLLTTEDWDLQAQGNMQLNTYLPFNEKFEFRQDEFITGLFHNPGFSFDLGATIELPYDLGVAISINDLGYIFWQNDKLTNQFNFSTNDTGEFTQDGNIFFDGFELALNGLQDGQLPDISTIFDSIATDDFFTYTYKNIDNYRSSLYPKLYVEAFYKLSNYRFTILSRTDFVGKKAIPSFTFACNAYYGDIVELTLTYSIYNRTFSNVGFGAHFHFGPVQWYFAFDNLIGPIAPKSFNNFSLQSGLFLGIRPKVDKNIRSSYM
ncbi:MAG: hypothetical protein KBA86_08460 [Bacteroidales bacterium]|nr:hypothetical protein [Bacteroidales bacterium]